MYASVVLCSPCARLPKSRIGITFYIHDQVQFEECLRYSLSLLGNGIPFTDVKKEATLVYLRCVKNLCLAFTLNSLFCNILVAGSLSPLFFISLRFRNK